MLTLALDKMVRGGWSVDVINIIVSLAKRGGGGFCFCTVSSAAAAGVSAAATSVHCHPYPDVLATFNDFLSYYVNLLALKPRTYPY